MPTGYTDKIKDGISFNDFALNCARNFGACITMRDDSSDTPIPKKFLYSTYHTDNIENAKRELFDIKVLTEREINKRCKFDYDEEFKRCKKIVAGKIELRNKYLAMIHKITMWNPPTSKHEGLKSFMLEQVTSSIKFDCDTKYYINEMEQLKLLDVNEWLESKMESLLHDVTYHTKEHAKEVSRIDGRNKWIKDLRDSLK